MRFFGIVLISLLAAGTAFAGPIMIGPLRLDLGPRARVASVTLTNEGDEIMNVQAKIETWSQADPAANGTPTDEVLISPPISALPPHRAQIFRVALRRPLPPGPERTYRVVLADVTPPPPATAPNAPAISFRISQSLPLFVQTAPNAKPVLAVGSCANPDPKSLCVEVRNTGDSHTIIQKVGFKSSGFSAVLTPKATILAGGRQAFATPRPKGLAPGAQLTVDVAGDGAAPVSASLRTPGT